MAQRGAAGVLAENQVRAGDADQGRGHDFVAERVGQHAVLMDAGLVGEGVVADDGLVGRGLEGDELAEHLAGGIELVELDAGGDAVAVAADVECGGDLFQGGVAGAFADAVDGALDLARAVLNGGPAIGSDYRKLMAGQSPWRQLLDRYGFDLALLPNDWALSTALDREPGWRRVYQDSVAVLYQRQAGALP